MPSPSKTYRQLQFEERVTLASLHQQGLGVRAIARTLQRSPSTVSRELQRNTCEGSYTSSAARSRCRQRRLLARPARKLDRQGVLFGVVHRFLGLRWSPEQIAMTLAGIYPKGHACRTRRSTAASTPNRWASSSASWWPACAKPITKRTPRSKGDDRRGQIPGMLSIHVRPPEVYDRQFPSHWQGDLMKGADKASAVGSCSSAPADC